MRNGLIRNIAGTTTAAMLAVLFLSPSHFGFLVILLSLLLLPGFLYSLYIIIAKPQQRLVQTFKAGIWCVALSLIVGIHYARHIIIRQHANELAMEIRLYMDKHGHCPERLEDVGWNKALMREKLGYSSYFCKNGKPSLFYMAPYIIFDSYYYDFTKRNWQFRVG